MTEARPAEPPLVPQAPPLPDAGPRLRLAPHLRSGVPALIAVALMLVWAVQNGGFDASTWYWGALVLLATFAGVFAGVHRGHLRLSRTSALAVGCFAGYVAWSYLSIAWAQYPGLALDGSNRALMYLLVFSMLTSLPWTRESAVAALLLFALGIGVIAVVLLARLASGDNVGVLFVGGRLAAPTGYINSTAALFTIEALVSIVLAARQRLPGPLRGLLMAFAAASLQLAIIAESRGWLFTLPIVGLVAVLVVPDRLRVAGAAVIPFLAALIPLHQLLRVYQSGPTDPLGSLAMHGARPALAVCIGAFVLGTLLAWGDGLYRGGPLSRGRRRAIGSVLALIGVGGVLAGGLAVSKGDPLHFISRQWAGFSHETQVFGSSHFTDVGSGRYDFWRVALDAFVAHPIGGLGQDNFGDYYLLHRHTAEEPSWTHSLELRLLASTGIVGTLLFGGFLLAAIAAALRTRRRGDPDSRLLAGAMLLPLVVWLVHGSLDWFWEVPALTAPALGFLGVAAGLGTALERTAGGAELERTAGADAPGRRRRLGLPSPVLAAAGGVALLCATVVLAFPYMSAHELSVASGADATNPSAALKDLRLAARLNPLSSDPGRLAGAIALRTGAYSVAAQRFKQSISAEPQGWFSWLGAGLAASALGDPDQAHHDFVVAKSINSRQPAVTDALQRVYTKTPLTSDDAFKLLIVVQ